MADGGGPLGHDVVNAQGAKDCKSVCQSICQVHPQCLIARQYQEVIRELPQHAALSVLLLSATRRTSILSCLLELLISVVVDGWHARPF